ncbi:MAG: protein kinase [Proteobacteria bacterium]|nr:protein kinase [Pseudomonadota bacterium]
MATGRRFNLVRELGSGAFGTVYLAEMESQGGFKKEVAIKLLNPELSSFSEASQRLRDEARLLGRLRNRHIVAVDDLVRLDGRWAVVMEHIAGYDLEVLAEALPQLGERVPPLAAVQIARAITVALDAAYNGTSSDGKPLLVVHRDIKPSNVRLSPDGEVKVLDFGIARADFAGREAKTGRVRYGSVGYMSPERLLGEPEVAAGDVFAAGCVLYELLVGSPLGRVELAPDAHAKQVEDAVTSIQQVLVDAETSETTGARAVLGELGDLLRSSLAYEPEHRPSAKAVADGLRSVERALAGEDVQAWAQRVIPKVNEVMDDHTRPARGVLDEETGETGARASGEPQNPTLVFDELLPGTDEVEVAAPPPGFEPAPDPAPVAASAPAIPDKTPMYIGAAVALLAVLGVGGWFATRELPVEPVPDSVVQPAPEPVVEPAIEPEPVAVEPVVEADPVVEAEPVVADAPARPRPVPEPIVTEPEPEPAPAGPRLRAVKFAVAGAAAVKASCGDVSGAGTSSALLRDLPAGACAVVATVDGTELKTTVSVDAPRGIECSVAGDQLTCR